MDFGLCVQKKSTDILEKMRYKMHRCVQGQCSKLLIQDASRCNICILTLLLENSSLSLWEGDFFLLCYRWYSGALGTGKRADKSKDSIMIFNFSCHLLPQGTLEKVCQLLLFFFLGKPLLIKYNQCQVGENSQ